MPVWAFEILESLVRLLIRLFCRLYGADEQAIDALLDMVEEMGAL